MNGARVAAGITRGLLALGFLLPAEIVAQSPTSPAPDSAGARQRNAFAQQPAFSTEAIRVLMAAPGAPKTAESVDSLAATSMLAACATSSQASSADSTRLSMRQPTDAAIREMAQPLAASDSVTIVIAATSLARRTCEWEYNASPTALWNGLAFSTEKARMPEPASLAIRRDASVIPGTVSRSRDARWDGSAWDTLGSRLVIRLPVSALAPRADGSLPAVRLQVARDSGRAPADERIPDSELRHLAFAVTIFRLDGAAAVPSGDWLTHPSARARAVLDDGDRRPFIEAMGALSRRSLVEFHDRDAPVAATVRASQALFAESDSASARWLLRDLSPVYPCLDVTALRGTAVGRELELLAAANACVPSDARHLLMRGLLAPGGAAWVNHGKGGGAFSSALILGSFGMAVQNRRMSDASYSEYLAARSYSAATALYAQSSDRQAAARQWAIRGAALWLADAVLESAWGWYYSRWRIAHDQF